MPCVGQDAERRLDGKVINDCHRLVPDFVSQNDKLVEESNGTLRAKSCRAQEIHQRVDSCSGNAMEQRAGTVVSSEANVTSVKDVATLGMLI